LLAACTPSTTEDTVDLQAAFLETWSEVPMQGAGPTIIVENRIVTCIPGLGLVSVNASDPEAPTTDESIGGEACVDLATAAGWIYMVEDTKLSIRHPSTWEIQGELDLPAKVAPTVVSFDASNDLVWIAGDQAGAGWLGAVNIRAPAEMRLVVDAAFDQPIIGVAQDSEGAYVMQADGSLVFADREGVAVGSWPAGSVPSGRALGITDHHLYVARATSGIEVIDLNRPDNPSAATGFALQGSDVASVFASGSRVYLGLAGGLAVLDSTKPASPELVGQATLDSDAVPFDLAIGSNLAAFSDGSQERLFIVNVNEMD
jgi:hypothetical protein